MTLQLLHSEFPYIWGKFDFLFYQCEHRNGDLEAEEDKTRGWDGDAEESEEKGGEAGAAGQPRTAHLPKH